MSSKSKKIVTKDAATDAKGFKFFGLVGRYSVRYKWLVLVIWILAAVLISANLPSLSSVTQSNNSNFLPANSPTEKALKIESAFEPSNVATVEVIIATPNGELTANDQANIIALQNSLKTRQYVKNVVNRGKSADGQAEILEVQFYNASVGTNPTPFIQSLRSTTNSSEATKSGLEVHLTGALPEQVDESKGSGKDNSELQLGTVIFIIILLLLIFRAPLAPLITLFPPIIVVTIAGPIIALAAQHGLKVSSLAQLLLTVLVLGAGTDYGLFLIFRVREELNNGLSVKDAIEKSLSRVGESITFSAATVIAALLSLLFATFQIYSTLGAPLAIGVGIMLLAGLTLLPALLGIFGRAVFWPIKLKKREVKKYGLWGRVCAKVVKHPLPVLICGVIFFGSLALALPGYKAGGFGGSTSPPSTSDSAKGNALLAQHFPNTNSNPTFVLFTLNESVWENPSVLTKIQEKLNSSTSFDHVTGPLNPIGANITEAELVQLYAQLGPPQNLPLEQPSSVAVSPELYQAYRATAQYISADGKTIQYNVGLSNTVPGSTAAMNEVPALRNEIQQIADQTGVKQNALYGESSAFYDISNLSNNDLKRVVPIAIIVIGLLLGILMRSLVAPLYLVASVVMSYLAALGLSVILFLDVGNGDGIVFILPFLMFIFLLALGEDYNILVMTRIREEAHGHNLKDAVTEALNTTGTTVTSAGLVLAGTFTVLGIVGGQEQVQDIGFGLAIGILMDTFLVRTLIVPAIVVLLGKWNWWPSKHGTWVESED